MYDNQAEPVAWVADEWTRQMEEALALLSQPSMPMRQETWRTVRGLVEGMRARWVQEWVV